MDPRTKCGITFSSSVIGVEPVYTRIYKNWSDRLATSNTFCGSRPTRAEVCRTPLASLVDSPDPLEVRRGGGNGRERVSEGEGRNSQRYVRRTYEGERKTEKAKEGECD